MSKNREDTERLIIATWAWRSRLSRSLRVMRYRPTLKSWVQGGNTSTRPDAPLYGIRIGYNVAESLGGVMERSIVP
jgi:hypothetical protein